MSAIVVNPGSQQWITHAAIGLLKAGVLQEFVIPVGSANSEMPHKLGRLLPVSVRKRFELGLRRRQLPDALQELTVNPPSAAILECLRGVVSLCGLQYISRSLQAFRNVALDRYVARQLQDGNTSLITSYTAGVRSLRRAKELGIVSYLDYPVAHHRFAEAILWEELHLKPDYAATLPPPTPQWIKDQLDEEIALADRIFVLSNLQRRTFMESAVDPGKLILTPLGVDLDLFRPAERQRDGVFRVLFTGQITQRKGISYLVDAFERLGIPDSELLLVGTVIGTDLPWRARSFIRRVPHVSRWELPNVYASADVYVLPSLVEGFPQTALEAMACGLPVIVSENTFGTDVITDGVNGFVVPIRDRQAIQDRLSYLYEHPAQRRQMGVEARRRAEDFSWKRYSELVVAALTPHTCVKT